MSATLVVATTGAARGLGRAYALAFAAEGAAVVVNDIRREAAETVAAEITGAGGWSIITPIVTASGW